MQDPGFSYFLNLYHSFAKLALMNIKICKVLNQFKFHFFWLACKIELICILLDKFIANKNLYCHIDVDVPQENLLQISLASRSQ